MSVRHCSALIRLFPQAASATATASTRKVRIDRTVSWRPAGLHRPYAAPRTACHHLCVRILVVEDEPGLRDGLIDLLRGDGHDVLACADGASAAARGLAEPFDVVLLD